MPEFTSVSSAVAAIRRDVRKKDRAIRRAVSKTAARTAKYVQRTTTPVAFGGLEKSVHSVDRGGGNADVVADARHAAAVEKGTGPHWVPLAPLVAWVKLRGAQGLTTRGRIRGDTTGWKQAAMRGGVHVQALQAARHIARAIRQRENGGATPVDAPTQVARAIQAAIAKRGTRPQPYMMRAIPFAEAELDRNVHEALSNGS